MILSPTTDVHLFVYCLLRAMASSHHHTYNLRTGPGKHQVLPTCCLRRKMAKEKKKEAEIKGTKVQEGRDFGRDQGA